MKIYFLCVCFTALGEFHWITDDENKTFHRALKGIHELRQGHLEDFRGLGQLEEMGPLCDTIAYTISMHH